MTPLTRPLVLAAALILAGGILAVSLPAASSGAAKTTKLCHSQTASVSGGAYIIDNNEWGSSAPECIITNGKRPEKIRRQIESIQARPLPRLRKAWGILLSI